MLPVRIELTTSALPRMRSTTELRQHIRGVARLSPRHAGLSRRSGGAIIGRMGDKDERAERLAAQLRANLKRRKEQARGVGPKPTEGEGKG